MIFVSIDSRLALPGEGLLRFSKLVHYSSIHCRWGGESDDNDGTPPADYILQSLGYEGQPDNLTLLRTDASDASTLSKGDSALDLTYLADEVSSRPFFWAFKTDLTRAFNFEFIPTSCPNIL